VHGANIRQVALQRVEDFALTGDAGYQDVIARHAGDDTVEPGVTPHADPLGDEDVLRAAERGIAGKFSERPFRLVNAGENLAFDDDLGCGRHFEIFYPALGKPIRFAEQTADDIELSYVRRIGVDH
jgi:hypothetical protein